MLMPLECIDEVAVLILEVGRISGNAEVPDQ